MALPGYDPAVRMMERVLKLCDEKGADTEIREGVQLAIQLSQDRIDYCERVSTGPSEALKTLADDTMAYPFAKAFDEGKTNLKLSNLMMSGHLEGKFLQSLVMLNRAKTVLEVGMFTGYAALACAEVLPEDGEVVTCEFEPFLKDVAMKFFNNSVHGKKIDIRIGPASDTLKALGTENRKFDVIFIDANKVGYKEYYQIIMSENLLSEQGVIVFDNCLYYGQPYCFGDGTTASKTAVTLGEEKSKNGHAITELNELIMSQNEVFKVLLPVRDGVLVVQRKTKL